MLPTMRIGASVRPSAFRVAGPGAGRGRGAAILLALAVALLVVGPLGPVRAGAPSAPIAPPRAATPLPAVGAAGAPRAPGPAGFAPVAASAARAVGTPAATSVDPYLFHTREPAPLGIADYGVDQLGSPMSYTTGAFLGVADLGALTALNASLGTPHDVGLQLNVNLLLTDHGTSYVYWVQDVVDFNTTTETAQFLNNIWNSSSAGGATFPTGSIVGNGSVYSGLVYIDVPPLNLPGNNRALTLPTSVALEVVTEVVAGIPEVVFEYNDGFGWVAYDRVSFPYDVNVTDNGYLVDGYSYSPLGDYLDAELAFGGPGGGAQTTLGLTNASLHLRYWNGENFQSVVNAYNFGGDTAEGVANGISSGASSPANGSLFAHVVNGSGSLGVAYDRSEIAVVNLTAPFAAGRVTINGTPFVNFTGGGANLTLAPGNYTLGLEENGSLLLTQAIALTPGEFLRLPLAQGKLYSVVFAETGLPAGTLWSVTYGGQRVSSNGTSIAFLSANGSTSWTVGGVYGLAPTPANGTTLVAGADVTVTIRWATPVYAVVFAETGLPAGTAWSVTFHGAVQGSVGPTIAFNATNGTYAYTVGPVAGYGASNASGFVNVFGAALTVPVRWTAAAVAVTVVETGLPAGAPWAVAFEAGGVWTNASGSGPSLVVQLASGVYNLTVTGPSAYAPIPPTLAVVVTGSPQTVPVRFAPTFGWIRGSVVPAGASVSVNGTAVATAAGAFNVSIAPGRYNVTATLDGYATEIVTVTVVAGAVTWANLTLRSTVAAPAHGPSVPLEVALLVVGLAVGVAVGLLALVARRRRPRRPDA